MLDDRAERERGEKRQRADDDNRSDEQSDEEGSVSGQSAGGDGDSLLRGETAGDGEHGNNDQESAHEHGDAEGHVVPGCVRAEAPESAAVIGGRTRKGVKHFGESVRPAVSKLTKSRSLSRHT